MTDFTVLVNELEAAALNAGQGWVRSEQHVQDKLEARVKAAKAALHAALSAHSTGSAGVAAEPVAWAWERLICGYTQPDAISRWVCEASAQKPEPHHLIRNIEPLFKHPPVAGEPVAGWKLVPVKPTSEMRKACWTGLGIAESCRAEFEQSGVHYFAKMIAAAPIPPAGGGETEAHPICGRPTLYDRGECCGKTPCASPASPAGDLISLSGDDLDTLDWVASELRDNGQTVAAVIVTKAAHIATAPAAPRKGPSEEEIARLIADELGFFYDPTDVEEAKADDPKPEDYLRVARAILALLTPADRGETQAVGESAR